MRDSEIPSDIDVGDGMLVQQWVRGAFAEWFLKNRDELLAKKWVKRGWAVYDMEADALGHTDQAYRVKPGHAWKIDAWLEDEID